MELDRPDLSQVEPHIVAYIEALEAQIAEATADTSTTSTESAPAEAPSNRSIVTLSRRAVVKRTPRHFYGRQRRGGMGVFDLQLPDDDAPAHLTVVDDDDHLLVLTDQGRAYRLALAALAATAVRARGASLADHLPLNPGEEVVAILPATSPQPYLTLASRRGWVRRIRGNYVGGSLIQGTAFHNVKEGGELAAAAWTPGDGDLFLATRAGLAIRFQAAQVPTRGCLGLRVDQGDAVVAVTGVSPGGGVFLLGHDGKGTIRLMDGFRANKAPGAGGKVALKTEQLVAALAVEEQDDILAISRLGKAIRFAAAEVPAKSGVVQGVNCLALRADDAVTATRLLPLLDPHSP